MVSLPIIPCRYRGRGRPQGSPPRIRPSRVPTPPIPPHSGVTIHQDAGASERLHLKKERLLPKLPTSPVYLIVVGMKPFLTQQVEGRAAVAFANDTLRSERSI